MMRGFLSPWRAQGFRSEIAPRDGFDEVVVGSWLHFETMGPRHVWGRVGPLQLNVTLARGVLKIRIDRRPRASRSASKMACRRLTFGGSVSGSGNRGH